MKTKNNGSMQVAAGIKGCENYEFSESSENLPSELLQNEAWILNPQNEKQKKYMENEGIYRSFVYENYLNVPEDYKALIDDMFWKNQNTDINIYQASEHIRKVLYDNLSIVEVPQKTADKDDCLKWCLTESREGNSVFFASAAVMAYRAVGIPARYAEGYIVGSDALIQGKGKADITSENSHAWPEVYFDGMGWMPVDVTPGYYFDVYSLQQMLIQNKGSEKLDESLQDFGADIEDGSGDFDDEKDINENELFTFLAFSGIITLIEVLLIIILILSELYRLLITGYARCKYNKMNEKEKTVFIYEKITDFLQVCGISAVLGKDSHITDESVAQKFSRISSGEYTRVYDLVEKTVYGDIELLPHEQRVIKVFFRKLIVSSESFDLKTRIKLRYYIPKIY